MNESPQFIDVREPSEYILGHVKGAINIPSSQLLNGQAMINDLDKNSKLIVYCRSGSRSQASIAVLKKMGFTDLTNGISAEYINEHYSINISN